LTDKELDECWLALGDADAAKAFAAIQKLALSGQAPDYFEKKLLPVSKESIRRNIAGLADDLEEYRRDAEAALVDLGKAAIPHLESAKRDHFPSERIAATMPTIAARVRAGAPFPTSREQLRRLRAIEVLERTGSRAAAAFLSRLAKGLEAPITAEAKSWRQARRLVSPCRWTSFTISACMGSTLSPLKRDSA